jgi:hypothetical protein
VTRLVWVATALALLVAGCGRSTPTEPRGTGPYASAYRGLCHAAADARRGNVALARTVFYDQSHQPIHQLAAATEAEAGDRAVAGRLLEAKQPVEAQLLGQPTGHFSADFDRLTKAMATAMAVVSHARPDACPR